MASRTEGTKILNHCERCKYFHTEVREGGGWLEYVNSQVGEQFGVMKD